MPDIKTDILIYAPFKQENLSEKELKWIEEFQTILKVSLNQITKHEITISNLISEESLIHRKENFEGVKIVIQLLINKTYDSSNVLNSQQFYGAKLLRVIAHPEIKEESAESIIVVNLFDEVTNKKVDLSENISELKNEIWLKFLDVAYEIKKFVNVADKKNKKHKGKIFVAETSIDQNIKRETVIRELEHIGFEVLPISNFPKDMVVFSEFVHDNLKESFMSVHIIGNYYAPLLNNIDISSVELQNDIFHEVAAELNAENNIIKRLVWIPPDLKPKSEKQKLYIESFKRNIELLKDTEIIQTPIEVFKTILTNKAEEVLELRGQLSSTKPEPSGKTSVYLISNDITKENYNKIKQELTKHKVELLESTIQTNKIELIQEHYFNLINCDALLIDYSIENPQWLNSKLSDIIKSPGFGRRKSFLAKSVLINLDVNLNINLQINDLDLIMDNEKDIPTRLNSFIEKINKNDT